MPEPPPVIKMVLSVIFMSTGTLTTDYADENGSKEVLFWRQQVHASRTRERKSDTSKSLATPQSCISATPAALDRYPCGFHRPCRGSQPLHSLPSKGEEETSL